MKILRGLLITIASTIAIALAIVLLILLRILSVPQDCEASPSFMFRGTFVDCEVRNPKPDPGPPNAVASR
jgi:hypothetical protein